MYCACATVPTTPTVLRIRISTRTQHTMQSRLIALLFYMAALLNDYGASAIKEPLIQHPGNDPNTKDVENGDQEPRIGTIVGADSTYPKEQESKCNVNVDVFANSVKYSSGTSDTTFINGIYYLL